MTTDERTFTITFENVTVHQYVHLRSILREKLSEAQRFRARGMARKEDVEAMEKFIADVDGADDDLLAAANAYAGATLSETKYTPQEADEMSVEELVELGNPDVDEFIAELGMDDPVDIDID